MSVALVHDWLTGMRGGERVLERIARRWPAAPIHTLVWQRGSVSAELESHPIRTSLLQRLPAPARLYRWYLPLYPAATASLDLSGADIVVSTSHAAAKNVRVPRGAFHLSYLHTPMRYVWDLEQDYFPPGRFPWPVSALVRGTCARLRAWDRAASDGVDAFLANSHHVAERIRRHYGRDAEVVYPPVPVERFTPATGPRGAYLVAGAFAPYKRADLALEACAKLGARVVVAGSGQDETLLRRVAPAGTRFLGWLGDAQLAELYAGARALLFPGEEDFGIMPVEAMASGCPVVAYGRGGALETVGRGADAAARATVAAGGVARVPGGVLFGTQSVACLLDALRLLEREPFDPAALARHAAPFATARFDAEFDAAFRRAHARWAASRGAPAASDVASER